MEGMTSCGTLPLSIMDDEENACSGSNSTLMPRSSEMEAVTEFLRDETPLMAEAGPDSGRSSGVRGREVSVLLTAVEAAKCGWNGVALSEEEEDASSGCSSLPAREGVAGILESGSCAVTVVVLMLLVDLDGLLGPDSMELGGLRCE